MNWDEWKKTWKQALELFLALALAIAFYFFLLRFYSFKRSIGSVINILMPFIYGGVMAYLLKTPCNFFDKFWEAFLPEKWKKHKTGISVLTVLILVFLILYTLLRTVIPQVVSSITVLAGMVPEQVNHFFDWVSSYLNSEGVVQNYVRPIAEDLSTKMVDWANTDLLPYLQNIVANTLNSLVGIVSNLGIGFIVCVYALCARKKFARQGKAVVYSILNPKYADSFMNELRFADKTFDGFLSGKILDSAIVGLICYGFCLIMAFTRGFSNGILISLIIGVTNIIPYFGPFIGTVPTTLMILMSDPIGAVIFLIFIIILQQFDGNVLGPKLLAGSVGLSGFWVLFSITVFGGFFGFVGVLIGVPVFAVIYDLIRKLVRRGLQRHHKEELLEDENRIGEEVTETKPARLSPGEHLEQKLDERILRRELEAMEKAQEEEMKEKEQKMQDSSRQKANGAEKKTGKNRRREGNSLKQNNTDIE